MAENCQEQERALKAKQATLSTKSSQCIVIEPNERFLFGNSTNKTVDMYKCDLYKPTKTRCPARLYVDRNTRRFVRRGEHQHNHLLDVSRIGAEIIRHDTRERATSTSESSTVRSDLLFDCLVWFVGDRRGRPSQRAY